jgi:hypothetical protein
MGGAVSAFVVFCVLLLVGLPVALSLPGPAREWTGLAFEALVIGVVAEMLVAIVLLHAGYYSLWTALVATLMIVGAATVASRRFGGPAAELSSLRRLDTALIGLGALVFVVVALRIRHAPSYFIFQTGDMGGYVNTANILRRSGGPYGTQPQGFTLFLRETNLLLGRANTVAGLPALGAALVLGAGAFARVLRLHIVAAIGIGLILLVHPVAVWFSQFPVSEALFAVLLLALLYLVLQTRATGSTAYAVIAGLVVGALLLVRGEAVLLGPILTLLLLASTAVDEESTARVQLQFTFVALVTLVAAYAYDVTYAHTYFRMQLRHLMPHFASHFAERAKLEHFSVALVLAGVLALALVLGLAWVVRRYARPRLVARPLLFWRVAYGAVIVIALLALFTFHLDGLTDTWARWGAVLLLLVAIGGVGVVVRPGRYLDAACGFLLLLVIGVFVVLFARRVPHPKLQTYYLYFDRYLFSEVLPAALPLAAIGMQIVVDACTRFAPVRVAKVAIAAVVVLVVVGLVPQVHETERITKYRLLGHPYEALHRIDQLTRTYGAGPVVYSGSRIRPKQWFYPNTYRAFALPLRQSFDRVVFGIPNKPLGKDDLYSPATALAVLHAYHRTSGYLVKLRVGRRHLADDEHTKWLGRVVYTGPLLGQRTSKPAAPWTFARLRFDVYALS